MLLGRIRFGNVILMPQSLPGEGSDETKLIHGVKMAPPHTYIATYLYIRHGFKADAMMHLGTHGSLEFTPWKQVALSSYDWPDVLVGEMPHYYLYIINNIGEAQIAKRRSYATMVSHLTPPFMNAEGFGYITDLQDKLYHFETADNAKLKAAYGKSIIELVKKEHIDRDLKLSGELAKGNLTADDLSRIEHFLHEITDAKVNRGMYIIGRPYSKEEADETARLMTVDAIADAMFKADVAAGKVSADKRKNKSFYRQHYLLKAHDRARQALIDPEPFKKKTVPAKKTQSAGVRKRGGMMGGASPETMQRMMKSGKLPDGRDIPPAMMAAMQQMMKSRPGPRPGSGRPRGMMGMMGHPMPPKEKEAPEVIAFRARADLLKSTESELKAILNVFSGGYLEATSGGDPILNPDTVPTGKNLYGIDPERTPTKESYAVGKELAEALIAQKLRTTGKYPKKVGFSLWGGEFIRTQGTNIGEIFYLLGVEPIWDSRGRVQDVRLIPLSELKRPRIDVIIQTSGQFRGAATSRMKLIDKAVRLAAMDPDGEFANYVKAGSLEVVKAMIASGMSAEQAKELGNSRIFGGVNGNFGTGVTGMAQNTGKWEDTKVIADLYLNNMGALYTEGHWGEHIPGVFKAALTNTDTVVQSRSSNSWGPLSLDHVYEFTGGLSLAARHVTGKDPAAYFNDLRNPGGARIQEAGEAAMVEARSTVLNPKYIKEMMKEGAAATGSFTEVFRNTLGWEIMKPDMLEDHLWQAYKETYVDDKLKLNMREFFEKNNPAALQEMTGIMLEAVRKEFWKADADTVKQLAKTHAELMKKFDLPPTRNEKLREMIRKNLQDPELRKAYEQQIAKMLEQQRKVAAARKKADEVSGRKLKAQTMEQPLSDRNNKRSALMVIAGLVVLALLAIFLGNRRKKNTL
jgi:cobaltochelatase CobN